MHQDGADDAIQTEAMQPPAEPRYLQAASA